MTYHKSVLLEESVKGLNIRPEGTYADLTFGGGGHSHKILENLGRKGRLLAFDQDPDSQKNIKPDSRLTFIHANFRYIRNFLRYYEIENLDGILADLGISSHQIDIAERGFTYLKETSLDMRMNRMAGKTAADILNNYGEQDLVRVFRDYGDFRRSKDLAGIILRRREIKVFSETQDFIKAIEKLLPAQQRNKLLSVIFQALRIEVNDEMGALKEMLSQSIECLKPGGRLVVLTYHSVEDRIVKNFIRSGNSEGIIEKDFYGNVQTPFLAINRSVIIPADKEIADNPRSRSAKLRIAEKI
jgi:16S rRNA (cytosine1402-N4)-methyltransferase